MTEQTDFWLVLHQLAEAYKSEAGLSDQARVQQFLDELYQKSPEARQELKAEMLTLLVALGDIYRALTAQGS